MRMATFGEDLKMSKIKIRITYRKLFILFMLLTYLKPYNAVLVPWINTTYQGLKVLLTLSLIVLFVVKRRRLSIFAIRGGIFLLIWGISMLYNTHSLGNAFQVILSVVGIFMLIDYYEWSDTLLRDFLNCIAVITKLYFVLNTVTVITQKPLFGEIQVHYLRYFLGGDNYWAFILIPLCGLIFLNDIFTEKHIRKSTWVFALMGFFDLTYQCSVAGMVAYGIYLIYMVFINYPAVRKLFKIRNAVVVGIILVLIATQLDVNRVFGPLLNLFGKTGFNSRETIWSLAINLIKKKWLIGYGYLTTDQINSYMLYGADHAHNIVLELLMDCGLVGTAAFAWWLYSAVGIKKRLYKDRGIQILQGCMVAFLVCSIFDFYPHLIYMYLFISVAALYKYSLYEREWLKSRLYIQSKTASWDMSNGQRI